MKKISEAKAELEVIMTEDNRIETALRKIDEGMDIIKDRQQLILMADSFETRWAAVKDIQEMSWLRIQRTKSVCYGQLQGLKKAK